MDAAQKYLEQARAAGMKDEDIIFDLTKQGWSIPQVHKLIYGQASEKNQLFASRYNPPFTQTQSPQPNIQPVLGQQTITTSPTLTTPVQPQMAMNQAMRAHKQSSTLKTIVIISVVVILVIVAAAVLLFIFV